ncbi:MAG: glycoside hydrolase family 9 protein [Oscillospiraceae bacterium]|nr:glycoside hydrolase family 9 protein [Oscillospiraceae bacterium]
MINKRKLRKVMATIASVAMLSTSVLPSMNVSAEVEMLSETSFEYKMLPWHTVESSPAKQNFWIEDGAIHIMILKAIGSDQEKWDLMTRYKNLSFKKGHTYTVSFKAKSNRNGLELCSNIGNVLGDKEYFVLNGDKMEHGPHMNGQWGKAAILTNKWQTFSGEFTPTEDLEGLIWKFEYASGTRYEGNAQDGDEIWFDDMSIVCQTCEPGDNCDVSRPDTDWGTNRDRSALVDPEKYAPDGKLVNYISVNQLGYYPKLSKIAVLSDNKGDIIYHASTIDLTENSYDFEICDAKTNEVKYKGKSGKAIKDEASGDTVYKLDFTEYNEPGTYYIKVGEWRSFDFRIAEDIYSENLLTDSINYFYQNRSGIDIESQYITSGNKDELAHAGGHKSDTAYVQKVWKNEYIGWQEIKETYTSSEITATGGWYDAGDHGKYVVNGGISVWTLQNMYERSVLSGEGKEKFSDASGVVMVPEAGNDIPDILDETAVELDWMTSMVVKEDEPTWGKYAGLVYHKLHDHKWTGLAVKPYIYEEEWGTLRIVKPPTFAATLNYVACTAQAARLWEPYDKEKADFYLEEAKKAYDAYLTHYYEADLAETVHPDFEIPCAKEEINEESLYAPKYHAKGGSPYGDYEVRDDAYWAACELYVTAKRMGDSSADKYYKELSEYKKAFEIPHKITGGENQKSGGSYTAFNWGNTATAGNMTLALNKDLISEEEYEKIKTSLVKTADEYISTEQSQGYGIPYLDDSPKYNDPFGYDYYNTIHGYEFASNSMVLNNAIVMAYAYELTEDPEYISGVTTAMDYLFGTNPLNFSFITGYGIYSGQKPYHKYWASEVDRSFPEAPDGVLLSGPNAYLDDPYIRAFGFAPYCDIPSQRCYMDSTESWSTNSASLEYNSSLAWVVSFLQDEATETCCPDYPEPVKPAEIKYGDLNSDGVSDLSDLTLLSLYLIGDISVSDDVLKAADVYYDGEVNIADLAHFKQYICKEPDIVLGPQK